MMEKDQSNEQQEVRKQSIYNENIVEIPTAKSVLLSTYSLRSSRDKFWMYLKWFPWKFA